MGYRFRLHVRIEVPAGTLKNKTKTIFGQYRCSRPIIGDGLQRATLTELEESHMREFGERGKLKFKHIVDLISYVILLTII
ncbi:MAG: hypothetical protein JWO95_2656 [Verrucomicrobiales bacterium]|nr:hypothetical protein [Verrucomicrobiales bacterium]